MKKPLKHLFCALWISLPLSAHAIIADFDNLFIWNRTRVALRDPGSYIQFQKGEVTTDHTDFKVLVQCHVYHLNKKDHPNIPKWEIAKGFIGEMNLRLERNGYVYRRGLIGEATDYSLKFYNRAESFYQDGVSIDYQAYSRNDALKDKIDVTVVYHSTDSTAEPVGVSDPCY